MFGIHQTPEHVRVEIKTGKIEKEHAILKFREFFIEDAAVFG